MAVNDSRSMNTDFAAGQIDGKVKNLTPDRGGAVEQEAVKRRRLELQQQYGLV